jgi:hypothetical protein
MCSNTTKRRVSQCLTSECNSMEKLGIVMDFKAKTITIDDIILPMRKI